MSYTVKGEGNKSNYLSFNAIIAYKKKKVLMQLLIYTLYVAIGVAKSVQLLIYILYVTIE